MNLSNYIKKAQIINKIIIILLLYYIINIIYKILFYANIKRYAYVVFLYLFLYVMIQLIYKI